MDQQTNIKSFDSSIFLNCGAFVRWRGVWYVYELGEKLHNSEIRQVKSISYRNFFDRESSHYRVTNFLTWSPEEWKSQWKSEKTSSLGVWQGPNRELYTKSFQMVQGKISLGEWQKAVPMAIDRIPHTLTKHSLETLLARLSDVPPNLMPFGFWTSAGGVIGASPELIYYRDQQMIESMALAGTQEKTGPCVLLNDEKNLKEHQFVVRELEKKWSQWGQVHMEPTEILELPTLYHLLTRFRVELDCPTRDEQLIQAFHPTSALGVFPYEKWRQLQEFPFQNERDNYGAPLVFPLAKKEESLAIVSLRQIQWNAHEIKLSAGGGVVKESQEELEWKEILAKMGSVKKLLEI